MAAQRIVIGDFLTGRNILDLETISDRWESRRNQADDISCVVDLADPEMRALGLYNAATAGKTYLAKIVGDSVMAFGLIERPRYNKARRTLQLRAEGIESYFRKRRILPLAAMTQPLIDPATGESNPIVDTVLTGWDLGTAMKKVIQQSMLWEGGNLPIVFEPDRAGTHTDTIKGSSLTSVTTLLENYASRQNGPDWEFRPQLTADRLGIELYFRTGTEADPRLHSPSVFTFDYSVPEPSVDDLIADIDASELTARAWTLGGRETGEAVVGMAFDRTLLNAGFPYTESVDNDHDQASEVATLNAYSMEALRVGKKPTTDLPFRVRTDQSPFPGEYRKGDHVDLIIKDDDYLPDDTYPVVISALAGNEDPDWITVTASGVPVG